MSPASSPLKEILPSKSFAAGLDEFLTRFKFGSSDAPASVDVTVKSPATSSFVDGLVVPIPTLPPYFPY